MISVIWERSRPAVAALAAHPRWLMVYGEGEHIDAAGQRLDRYPTRPPQVGLAGFRDYCFLCQPTVFWRRSRTSTRAAISSVAKGLVR